MSRAFAIARSAPRPSALAAGQASAFGRLAREFVLVSSTTTTLMAA
ncbi:MAG: hypothetical protein ABIR54_24190 [Burkholderiaceae bacterium]|jgi:hypothetical protein